MLIYFKLSDNTHQLKAMLKFSDKLITFIQFVRRQQRPRSFTFFDDQSNQLFNHLLFNHTAAAAAAAASIQ